MLCVRDEAYIRTIFKNLTTTALLFFFFSTLKFKFSKNESISYSTLILFPIFSLLMLKTHSMYLQKFKPTFTQI